MSIYFTVYRTTNLVNGKSYIGAHATDNPWDSYLGSGTVLKHTVKKHGRSNFIKEVLAVFDNPEDMWATESRLVSEAWINSKNTYNICVGGMGGVGFKRKGMTPWNKGKKMNSEQRKKLSSAMMGRKAYNKGLPNPNAAENARKGAVKLRQLATGRYREYREDGTWTWKYPEEKGATQ